MNLEGNDRFKHISSSITVEEFKKGMLRVAEQRRAITLARQFSAFVTREEAIEAAETVMEMRRRKETKR